jgi:hypothetical protein
VWRGSGRPVGLVEVAVAEVRGLAIAQPGAPPGRGVGAVGVGVAQLGKQAGEHGFKTGADLGAWLSPQVRGSR